MARLQLAPLIPRPLHLRSPSQRRQPPGPRRPPAPFQLCSPLGFGVGPWVLYGRESPTRGFSPPPDPPRPAQSHRGTPQPLTCLGTGPQPCKVQREFSLQSSRSALGEMSRLVQEPLPSYKSLHLLIPQFRRLPSTYSP